MSPLDGGRDRVRVCVLPTWGQEFPTVGILGHLTGENRGSMAILERREFLLPKARIEAPLTLPISMPLRDQVIM